MRLADPLVDYLFRKGDTLKYIVKTVEHNIIKQGHGKPVAWLKKKAWSHAP